MLVDQARTQRRIAYKICERGLPLTTFCELIGIDRKSLYSKHAMRLETAAKIAKGLGCGIDDLVVYTKETK